MHAIRFSSLRSAALTVWRDPARRRGTLWRLVLAAVLLALVYVLGRFVGSEIPAFEAWVADRHALGAVVFLIVFILATGCFVPETIFSLAAGAAFGLGWGCVVIAISGFVGAILMFTVARTLLRSRVARGLARHPKLQAIDQAAGTEGLKLLALVRLSPLNYTALNYVLGASQASARDFLLSCPAMLPGLFVNVYTGWVATHLARRAGSEDASSLLHDALLLAGVGFFIFTMVFAARVALRAVREATAEEISATETAPGQTTSPAAPQDAPSPHA